jgi:hypothetical protein
LLPLLPLPLPLLQQLAVSLTHHALLVLQRCTQLE